MILCPGSRPRCPGTCPASAWPACVSPCCRWPAPSSPPASSPPSTDGTSTPPPPPPPSWTWTRDTVILRTLTEAVYFRENDHLTTAGAAPSADQDTRRAQTVALRGLHLEVEGGVVDGEQGAGPQLLLHHLPAHASYIVVLQKVPSEGS